MSQSTEAPRLNKKIWSTTKLMRSSKVPYSSRIIRASSSCGQPCCACQASPGTQAATAMSAPIAYQRLKTRPRPPGTVNRPSVNDSTSTTTRSLLSRPIPTRAPATIHRRVRPVRAMRSTTQVMATHTAKSRVAVARRRPASSATVLTATVSVASTCAGVRPPSSRAVNPVNQAAPTTDATAGSRNTTREPWPSASNELANSGVSMPWSG